MNQTIKRETRDKRQGGKGNSASPALCTLFYAFCSMLAVLCFVPSAHAGENPLDRMTDDVLSYFKPVHGVITKVEGKTGFVNIGGKDAVRKGMRVYDCEGGSPVPASCNERAFRKHGIVYRKT